MSLSFERCVCFILIVVLAILRCSGFHIDRSAMGTFSQTNSHTSSTSLSSNQNNDFLSRLLSTTNISRYKRENPQLESKYSEINSQRHRIRHSRKLRNREQNRQTGRIGTMLFPPSDYELRSSKFSTLTPMASQQLAQIPPSDYQQLRPTASLESRSQRSTGQNKQAQKKRPPGCQEQDIARKTWKSNTVVLARAESMSSYRVHNYSVSFKVIKIYKNKYPNNLQNNTTIRLNFTNDTKRMNCENELRKAQDRAPVKAQIKTSREYFLFLNSDGRHSYTVYGMPVMKKRRRKSPILEKKTQNQEGIILRAARNGKSFKHILNIQCRKVIITLETILSIAKF